VLAYKDHHPVPGINALPSFGGPEAVLGHLRATDRQAPQPDPLSRSTKHADYDSECHAVARRRARRT
jgi:hypothetical protein